MLTHGANQQQIRYWFFGLDDTYPFELLVVALNTAKSATRLIPIGLHTGLNRNKLAYLDDHGVKLYEIHPDRRIAHSVHYGALLRMYIPVITRRLNINETVLYTDCDVIFYNHPPMIHIESVGAVAYDPWAKPSVNNTLNSGVMYLNTPKIGSSFESFIQFAIDHPDAHNAAAESIYAHFYDIDMLPHTLNYFSYWDPPDKSNVYILHFHGPKPHHDFKYDEISILYNDNFYKNKIEWRSIRSSIAIPDAVH